MAVNLNCQNFVKVWNLFFHENTGSNSFGFMYFVIHLWKVIKCFKTFQAFSYKTVKSCLKMKKSLNFNFDLQIVKGSPLSGKKNASVDLILMYKNQEKTVTEEILVYDTPGLVSQINGILSLFLGFSFFSLLFDLFELIQKIK